jgi:hypothetical protein
METYYTVQIGGDEFFSHLAAQARVPVLQNPN